MTIKEIIALLNQWAPPSYQESYDNAQLLTGDANSIVQGVLITLDCTEAVVDEAIEQGSNLIVAHHPIIFEGLKSLAGNDYVTRTIVKAIKNDIAIFAIHTNLDNVHTGVNKKITERLGLENCQILAPKKDTLSKLVAFVPKEATDQVLAALHQAGAGNIGNYSDCSFTSEGTGTFRPSADAQPYVGNKETIHQEQENKVELIFPSHLEGKVLMALNTSHPYEEVAYFITSLHHDNQEVGAGMIGDLPVEMSTESLLKLVKKKFDMPFVRHTEIHKPKVKKIAVCGGSGSFLIKKAIAAKADVFLSADIKYHEYFDADGSITIVDIGHYESEVFTKDLIYHFLQEKLPNIALNLSLRNTNPINYF